MKKKLLFISILTALIGSAQEEKSLNIGGGYFGHVIVNPGGVFELEFENKNTQNFSLSTRANLFFYNSTDLWSAGIDINQGYRKYLNSGFFFEQSMGVGLIHSTFKTEHFVYVDPYENSLAPGPGLNIGLMPSTSIGLGYDLTHSKASKNLIWIRPKAYWNFLYRDFSEPFLVLQFGYSITLKNI